MGMRSCREVTQLVSEGLDRELSLGERVAVRAHFLICAGCREFDGQLAFLRRALGRLGESDVPARGDTEAGGR